MTRRWKASTFCVSVRSCYNGNCAGHDICTTNYDSRVGFPVLGIIARRGNYGPNVRRATAALAALLVIVCSAQAAVTGLKRLATGLNRPVFATHAPGDRDRLFIVEKNGDIKILDLKTNTVLATPFLHIADTDPAGEGGLLGLAFHPNYFGTSGAGVGKFYVYVTVDNGNTPIEGLISPFSSHIREYRVSAGDPNVADTDPMHMTELLQWVKPASNHNGGWIGFNPQVAPGESQYLYITSGDGGVQEDPNNHAQTITNMKLGKILRIDVDNTNTGDGLNYDNPPTNPFVGQTGDDEIWAYGLRNPFHASFDRDTGNFWIADVGYSTREEIDRQDRTAPDGAGRNYQWKFREGTYQPSFGGTPPVGSVPPVYEYNHGSGSFDGFAVIGGYIYRGPDPTAKGMYYFADEVTHHLWRFDPHQPIGHEGSIDFTPDVGAVNAPASFGEDAVGNLYVLDYGSTASNPPANTGELYRLVSTALLAGDYDADGDVDSDDYLVWQESFGTVAAGLPADGNGNGTIDAADYVVWRSNLGASVHVPAGAAAGVPSRPPPP